MTPPQGDRSWLLGCSGLLVVGVLATVVVVVNTFKARDAWQGRIEVVYARELGQMEWIAIRYDELPKLPRPPEFQAVFNEVRENRDIYQATFGFPAGKRVSGYPVKVGDSRSGQSQFLPRYARPGIPVVNILQWDEGTMYVYEAVVHLGNGEAVTYRLTLEGSAVETAWGEFEASESGR